MLLSEFTVSHTRDRIAWLKPRSTVSTLTVCAHKRAHVAHKQQAWKDQGIDQGTTVAQMLQGMKYAAPVRSNHRHCKVKDSAALV